MSASLQRAALAATFVASLGGVAFAADFNPQPDPPGRQQVGKLVDGRLADVEGRVLLLGSSHTPAPAGRYALADGSIIFVGGKGQITKTTSALVNRLMSTGSKAMLNPQPLPP